MRDKKCAHAQILRNDNYAGVYIEPSRPAADHDLHANCACAAKKCDTHARKNCGGVASSCVRKIKERRDYVLFFSEKSLQQAKEKKYI